MCVCDLAAGVGVSARATGYIAVTTTDCACTISGSDWDIPTKTCKCKATHLPAMTGSMNVNDDGTSLACACNENATPLNGAIATGCSCQGAATGMRMKNDGSVCECNSAEGVAWPYLESNAVVGANNKCRCKAYATGAIPDTSTPLVTTCLCPTDASFVTNVV